MIVCGPGSAGVRSQGSCHLALPIRCPTCHPCHRPRAACRGATAALTRSPISPPASARSPPAFAPQPSRASLERKLRRLGTVPRGIGTAVEAGVAAWHELPLVVQGSLRLVRTLLWLCGPLLLTTVYWYCSTTSSVVCWLHRCEICPALPKLCLGAHTPSSSVSCDETQPSGAASR